jgi:hypothetical protein
MAKVSFNGNTRIITVLPSVTTLDVQIDLYSEWKRWSILDNNLRYLQAFRTFGGDPTVSGQFAPRYFFLMNGWRIVVDTGLDVNVGVNLFTDELDNPFILSNDSTVILRNSDSPVVDTGIAQTLDYNGTVNINSLLGLPGEDYPIGTLAQPVNNIHDAKIIAQKYGINRLKIFGELLVNEDLEGYLVIGGNLTDVVTFNNISLDKTTFNQCLLQGTYSGAIAADNCILNDGLTGMDGYFQYCGFLGKMYFSTGVTSVFNDCHSQVPGMNSPEMFLNDYVKLSLRKYSGGLAIYNSKIGVEATLEFIVGNCRLLTGNTDGTLVIRGLATLTDETQGTEVLIDGLITPNQKVFGGQIG